MKQWRWLALLLALVLAGGPVAEAQMAAGTVNARQSGTWNITNISGVISLPTSAAIAYLQAQTTLGQQGTLVFGAVTSAAPTYLDLKSYPLNMDLSGNLRVNCTTGCATTSITSIVTGQQSATMAATALAANAGKRICLKTLAAATQTIYFGPSGVTITTGQELAAADAWCSPIDNSNRIFIVSAATGSVVSYDVTN